MHPDYLTKTKLSVVLSVTKRTLTSYVHAGAIPTPQQHGRDVGWSIDALRVALESNPEGTYVLPDAKRTRLLQALKNWELSAAEEAKSQNDSLALARRIQHPALPEPVVEYMYNPNEQVFRGPAVEKAKKNRELVAYVKREITRATSNSPELESLWKEQLFHEDKRDVQDDYIRNNFVPQHSKGQFGGTQDLFVSPLFNVCNKRQERHQFITVSVPMPGEPGATYEGPELRQDDALVFMSLINIARDVRVGKGISFFPQELIDAIWGHYNGESRLRLHNSISRLQKGILSFNTFKVQLIQRFDFPRKGPWTVGLDPDIVRVFNDSRFVWLDIEQRLSMPDGLPSWLYAYIRSQTKLLPTKVAQLQKLCGSTGKLHGFRKTLWNAMELLVDAQLVCRGWSIDKHDMLQWKKFPTQYTQKFPTSP